MQYLKQEIGEVFHLSINLHIAGYLDEIKKNPCKIIYNHFGSITLTHIPTIYSDKVPQNPSTPVAAFGAFFCLASKFGCVPAWLATHQKTWRSLVTE